MRKIISFFSILLIYLNGFAQLGNENHEFDSVIEVGYDIIQYLYQADIKVVEGMYVESDFQTKEEFNDFLNKDNVKWVKEIVDTYGVPQKEELDISTWSVNSAGVSSTSLNLTYYFKEKGAPFSIVNDHISFHFSRQNNNMVLGGIMIFKKDDYLVIKSILDNIPQN